VASVGNVELRLIGSKERFDPVVRRGIIGARPPDPVLTSHSWVSDNLLIMHSDGLQPLWDWSDFRDLTYEAPPVIARRLLDAQGKADDDVTVLVIRSAV
jgi:serine/threonine protein phosphatase PrpC